MPGLPPLPGNPPAPEHDTTRVGWTVGFIVGRSGCQGRLQRPCEGVDQGGDGQPGPTPPGRKDAADADVVARLLDVIAANFWD